MQTFRILVLGAVMREGQGCGTPEEPSPNSSEIEEGFLEEVAYELKLGGFCQANWQEKDTLNKK